MKVTITILDGASMMGQGIICPPSTLMEQFVVIS
jgi:hypothetical protein